MTTATSAGAVLSEHYDRYSAELTALRERGAVDAALEALRAGMTIEDVLLEMVAPAQVEVGSRWARNEWTVAREHAATCISERALAVIASRIESTGTQGSLVVCCVEGEWHSLPARLLGEVARTRGWEVTFLGASLPTDHLASFIAETGPDAVAVSCSLATALPHARAAIEAVRMHGVPVLAGGAGFDPDATYAERLGATAWAPDARAAVGVLASGLPDVVLPAPEMNGGDAWRRLDSARDELSERAFASIAAKWPQVAGYTETQRRHSVDDLSHILEFTAIAQFLDDDHLLTRFLIWMREILAFRSVPAEVLRAGLVALVVETEHLPESRRLLSAGLESLS